MNLLLIQLYGYAQPPSAEPLAIEALGSYLIEEHKSVNLILETVNIRSLDEDIERVLNIISYQSPMLVGLSIPQSTLEIAYKLLDRIKSINNNVICVLGHALPTFSPNLFLEKYKDVVIVRGWGEESLSYLVKNLICGVPDIKKIPNLTFMIKDELIVTPSSWPEKIPVPIRLDVNLYLPRIETSRGCNYNGCSFCTRIPLDEFKNNKKWHRRDINDTLYDIRQIKLLGASNFTLTDEDFIGGDVDSAMQLADGILEIGEVKFNLAIRPDDVYDQRRTEDENQKRRLLFLKLKSAGLHSVFVGLESLSNSQLIRYGKGVSVEESVKNLQLLDQMEIDYELGFILFDPFLTSEELFENIKALEETKLWAKVGQIINLLRPQVSSTYIKKKDFLRLSYEYNPDTMAYSSGFADPLISDVAIYTRSWLEEFDQIYLLARSIRRVGIREKSLEDFVVGCRELLFRLVTEVAKRRLLQNESLVRYKSFDEERDQLIATYVRKLTLKENLLKTEEAILEEYKKFLSLYGKE